MRCRILLFFLCLVSWSFLPATPAIAAEYEIVPEGRWLFRFSIGADRQEESITKQNHNGSLKDFLITDESIRNQITGEITRNFELAGLHLGYGISDRWNLSLSTAFWKVSQESTLATGSPDPTVVEQVDRLASRNISGTGRITLTSLHRTLYSDRFGLIFGYGISTPVDDPQSPYAGRGTLYADEPFQDVFGLIQFTIYTFSVRGRVDLAAKFGFPKSRNLDTLFGESASIHPGNFGELTAGWEVNFGGFHSGIRMLERIRGQSKIDGAKQSDTLQRLEYRLNFGYGNLDQLEKQPLAFPYLLDFQYENSFQGHNTPIRSELRLTLQTYF